MRLSHFSGRVILFWLLAALSGSVVSAGTFPVENNRGYRTMKNRVRAAQFLSRTTFGPTQREIKPARKADRTDRP